MSNGQFDFEEFKESYTHYRHLEQERSRYLAFFFAMIGGLLGLLGYLLKDGKPITGTENFLFVGGLIIVFLQILDTVTFAAIRRMGDARAQHAATMNYIRGKLNTDVLVFPFFLPRLSLPRLFALRGLPRRSSLTASKLPK